MRLSESHYLLVLWSCYWPLLSPPPSTWGQEIWFVMLSPQSLTEYLKCGMLKRKLWSHIFRSILIKIYPLKFLHALFTHRIIPWAKCTHPSSSSVLILPWDTGTAMLIWQMRKLRFRDFFKLLTLTWEQVSSTARIWTQTSLMSKPTHPTSLTSSVTIYFNLFVYSTIQTNSSPWISAYLYSWFLQVLLSGSLVWGTGGRIENNNVDIEK